MRARDYGTHADGCKAWRNFASMLSRTGLELAAAVLALLACGGFSEGAAEEAGPAAAVSAVLGGAAAEDDSAT